MKENRMERPDGVSIYYKVWDDVSKPIGVLQIAHGMGEYIERYDPFARYLNHKGIIVYGNDHRGHGKTIGSTAELGSFGERNAWQKVVEDMQALSRLIRRNERNLPLVLLGHSMGSFLARTYIVKGQDSLEGVIIMGTGGKPGMIGKIGQMLIHREIRKHGWKDKSTQINKMVFGSNNKAIPNPKTSMDWLSRDEKQVELYIKDPYCGGQFDNGFYEDLLNGVLYVSNSKNLMTVPKALPLLLISGGEDPVGNRGKGVKQVEELLKSIGMKNVKTILYSGARHEILNEINRQEVFEDIFQWLSKIMSKQ